MSRIEKDCLGQMEVPDDVYYGIQDPSRHGSIGHSR